jgi:hypothetical protein
MLAIVFFLENVWLFLIGLRPSAITIFNHQVAFRNYATLSGTWPLGFVLIKIHVKSTDCLTSISNLAQQ